MDNLKPQVPDPTSVVTHAAGAASTVASAVPVVETNLDASTLVTKSFFSRLYDKKLYVLLLLVAVGAVVFYYKKKNALKSKLKDFKDIHQDFKPVSELEKDLQMKDLELTTLKQQNEQLMNDNKKVYQQLLHQQQQQQQQQYQQQQTVNNNDRLEEEVEYNNLGEDDNVQQFNLTNNEMNDVAQALEQ